MAAEELGGSAALPSDERRERMSGLSDQLSAAERVDLEDLMYTDRDRGDVADWLDAHGWLATALASQAEMRRLGRLADSSATGDDETSSTFVVAERY
jgi:O-methyltransferase involved in polyketide biosynthesis